MRWLALVLCLFALPARAAVFNHMPTYLDVKDDLQAENTRALADAAFDAMFRRASALMWEKGHQKAATDLLNEWTTIYKGSLLRNDDVGDHAPLSVWVAAWYEAIRLILGDNVMELSHLRDIWVLNFTIPVVFNPHAAEVWCREALEMNPGDTCEAEYSRHFAGTKWQRQDDPYADANVHFGFAPVVVYWCVFAGCEAALWGTDFTILCGEAGSLAEILMARYPAPRISNAIWEKRNP